MKERENMCHGIWATQILFWKIIFSQILNDIIIMELRSWVQIIATGLNETGEDLWCSADCEGYVQQYGMDSW